MRYTVYLIRHGKTKGNLEGRYIGARTDETLCEEGRQALMRRQDELRECIKTAVSVYASPMKRAVETAEILFPGQTVKEIPELSEIDFGDFENKNYIELNGHAEYQRWIDSGGKADYPHGEPLQAFVKRSYGGFQKVLQGMQKNHEAVAVLVCHGGNIMAIMSSLTGNEYFDFQVDNAKGYHLEVEIKEEEIDLVSYCCI